MTKVYFIKYVFILILLHNLTVYANSSEINNKFYKLGYIKKEKYNFSLAYSHYYNNNNFTINNIRQNNLSHTGYDLEIRSNNIQKRNNGIISEFGVQILPPLKAFISYNYKKTETKINYTIPYKSFRLLNKDYSSTYTIKDDEHTFMSGIELTYEYKYKNFVPYINFISAFGVTASTNYENIFYSMNIALQAGLLYKINKNYNIKAYTGVDYTSLYNGSLINDKVIINIPEEYLLINIPAQQIEAEFMYEEKYNNNINMTVGIELKLYKHYNIFLETKFINNLFINFCNLIRHMLHK